MGQSRQLRRGIYLLPTIFTVGNLFCGYSSIVLATRGGFELAAILIVVAGILDGLDGRIARLTRTTSEFGVEFDSLADIVSFGIAPALLAYRWALEPLGRVGWLIGFIFVVCAAMRLARFNIQRRVSQRRHFAGLPSPMAGGAIACTVFAFPQRPPEGWAAVGFALFVACSALLMVSRFRYRSFKEFDLRDRRSYTYVLPLAAIIVAVALRPKWALLSLSIGYLLSAPTLYVWNVLARAQPSGTLAPRESKSDTEIGDGSAYR